MITQTQVAFTTTAPGPFTLPHNLGALPGSEIFEFTTGGSVWFQTPTKYDANNLYLIASDTGVAGFAIIFAGATPQCVVYGNSTIRLQEVIDDALTLGDVAPTLALGGSSMLPALSIANDVMQQ